MRRDELADSIDGFALWLATEGKPRAKGTITNYCESARDVASWCRQRGISSFGDLTRPQIRAFTQSLRERGCQESTITTRWYALKSLFKYLSAEEWDGQRPSPMDAMTPPDPGQSDVPVLTKAELKAIFSACGSARDEAMVSILADCGVRLSELAGMKLDDLQLTPPARILVHGKGSKDRHVVPGDTTVLVLRRYLRQRGKEPGPLWMGRQGSLGGGRIRQIVADLGEKAGIPGLHPHQFRHSWAHHYRLSGGSPDDLCYLAGWSSMQMALLYGRSAAGERAEKAARALSLRDAL